MGAFPSKINKDAHYTYKDYCEWNTDERYELIDGAPYLMAPAPSYAHQEVVGELFGRFWTYLQERPCKVFVAPLDVRLNANTEDDTVVQPDLLVVCDRNKIDKHGIKGAPDLVIEVRSPSSRNYDSILKLEKYLQAGVRECWLVNTESNTIRVFTKNETGEQAMKAYGESDVIPVKILPGFSISLKEVFAATKL